ncbi:MAG: glycosyltransferase [bacterium]|nr:glycosyltransferase [bacterium]
MTINGHIQSDAPIRHRHAIRPSSRDPQRRKKYRLGVLALFKNEAMVIREWVEHHLFHGVEHFYLIDNGSTDGYRQQIREYLEGGLVTLIDYPQQHRQVDAYNHVYPMCRDECDWTAIIDLDEFMYDVNGRKIPDVLRTFDQYAGVGMPWVMFGSNGYERQPPIIVDAFTFRMSTTRPTQALIKTICNMRWTLRFNVHSHTYAPGTVAILSDRATIDTDSFANVEESVLGRYQLRVNHYAIQSLEYFRDVKMTRGDSLYSSKDRLRDINYFRAYDHHDVEDRTLSMLNRPINRAYHDAS